MTTTEAAATLGLTPGGVATLVYSGLLTPLNRSDGGPLAWEFSREEVERRKARRLETMRASGRGIWRWGQGIHVKTFPSRKEAIS